MSCVFVANSTCVSNLFVWSVVFSCGRQDDVDDREEFYAVDKALSSLDFTANDKTDMWRLLAAILHSGEVRC